MEEDIVPELFPVCINCKAHFEEGFDPISKVSISVLPFNESIDNSVKPVIEEEEATSVTILDALCTIFVSKNLVELKKSQSDLELSMCFKCAQSLSNLYQSYIELLTLSDSTALICKLIQQIGLWHHSRDDSDEFPEDPFACFVDAILELEEPSDQNRNIKIKSDKHHLNPKPTKEKRRKNPSPTKRVIVEESISNDDTSDTDQRRIVNNFSHGIPRTSRRSARIARINNTNRISKLHKRKKSNNYGCLKKIKFSSLADEVKPVIEDLLVKGVEIENKSEAEIVKEDSDKEYVPCDSPSPPKAVRRRGPRQRVKCEVDGCTKQFIFHWMMHNHVQLDHEKKEPKICCVCDFSSFDLGVFDTHICIEAETDEVSGDQEQSRPFRCNFCGSRYATKSILLQHARTHDRSILKCSLPGCNRTFLRTKQLETHELWAHTVDGYKEDPREESFQCSHCGKLFAIKATFKIHMEIHSSERKYLCNQCGMSFKQRRALTRHMLVHKELHAIRAHQCPLCGKCFKRKYNLTQHYHSKVHPQSIIEKLLNGEKLEEEDLRNSTRKKSKTPRKKDKIYLEVSYQSDEEPGEQSEEERGGGVRVLSTANQIQGNEQTLAFVDTSAIHHHDQPIYIASAHGLFSNNFASATPVNSTTYRIIQAHEVIDESSTSPTHLTSNQQQAFTLPNFLRM